MLFEIWYCPIFSVGVQMNLMVVEMILELINLPNSMLRF
jgi:hypothetical protein